MGRFSPTPSPLPSREGGYCRSIKGVLPNSMFCDFIKNIVGCHPCESRNPVVIIIFMDPRFRGDDVS